MWMTDEETLNTADFVTFGPFRLCVAQRLLEKSGSPLHLSARALDILIVLIERAGEVVSKKKLLARVWPDVSVDEGALDTFSFIVVLACHWSKRPSCRSA